MRMPEPNAKSHVGSTLRMFAPRSSDLLLLVGYGVGFALLHRFARPWGGSGFFSLWYPAAGLRFAVLWYRGSALTPWVMLTELTADIITGTVSLAPENALQHVIGALRSGLVYGVAIAAVRWSMERGSGTFKLPPMPFGVAAIAAPTLNAAAVVPLELMNSATSVAYRAGVDLAVSLTGLGVGDLLGVLVVAPPLLWLAGLADGSVTRRIALPPISLLLEATFIVVGAQLATLTFLRAGLGTQPLPALLAGAWIGLRHGRTAGWFAIMAETLLFLPYSMKSSEGAVRVELHLDMAAVVLATWLAGSFADAQTAASALLEKRNRLLFQAERLKTLRAMSVAVIHEISQPLSTLAIEARHLRERTADLEPDIADSAALVDRKAATLAEMVRRLRRFGGRDVDEPSAVPVAMVIRGAEQIVTSELRAQGGSLAIAPVPPDLVIQAQEIELTQVLVNLLRNAGSASPGEPISLAVHPDDDTVQILVSNPWRRCKPYLAKREGMGVGLIIARTIVEAHGGTLVRENKPDAVCFVITLPLQEPCREL